MMAKFKIDVIVLQRENRKQARHETLRASHYGESNFKNFPCFLYQFPKLKGFRGWGNFYNFFI